METAEVRGYKKDDYRKDLKPGVLLVGNFLSGLGGRKGVGEELADRLEAKGYRIFRAGHFRSRVRRLAEMLEITWVRRNSYEIAHVEVYSGKAFFWAEAVCWILQRIGKPYVLSLHGGNLPAFAQRHPERVLRLLRSARTVTSPSPYLQRSMAGVRDDILLLPNGVDLSKCEFRLRNRADLKMVWLRSFHAIYNPCMAVEVLHHLSKDVPAVSLIMIGADKGDNTGYATRELARKLGVTDRLDIVSGVPKQEVPHWLQKADVFLNTANVDNAPVSVVEAMACGLCVVSTNAGGIPWLIENETNALLVPVGDSKQMAEAAMRLFSNPPTAVRLSQNGRELAAQHDWEKTLSLWEQLLCLNHKHQR